MGDFLILLLKGEEHEQIEKMTWPIIMARKIAFGRNYKKELADWFKPVYKIIPKTMKKKI